MLTIMNKDVGAGGEKILKKYSNQPKFNKEIHKKIAFGGGGFGKCWHKQTKGGMGVSQVLKTADKEERGGPDNPNMVDIICEPSLKEDKIRNIFM